jgi:hypothetical protein
MQKTESVKITMDTNGFTVEAQSEKIYNFFKENCEVIARGEKLVFTPYYSQDYPIDSRIIRTAIFLPHLNSIPFFKNADYGVMPNLAILASVDIRFGVKMTYTKNGILTKSEIKKLNENFHKAVNRLMTLASEYEANHLGLKISKMHREAMA